MGCNDALIRFLRWLKQEIGKPPAPALVADTLTATSLSLEWELPKRLADLTHKFLETPKNFLVQYSFEETPGEWKFCTNHTIGENSTIRLDHLQPYTRYRVKLLNQLTLDKKLDFHLILFLFSSESHCHCLINKMNSFIRIKVSLSVRYRREHHKSQLMYVQLLLIILVYRFHGHQVLSQTDPYFHTNYK